MPGRIAFWREAPRNVWIMNADGTGQLQLTPDNDPWLHGPPTVALSPDGQWVAFDCEATIHVYDICIVKADGTGKAQLTDADGDDRFPAGPGTDGSSSPATGTAIGRSTS